MLEHAELSLFSGSWARTIEFAGLTSVSIVAWSEGPPNATAAFDAAIVDANLAGVSASPLASALTARGLPFIVLSGYSSNQLQGLFLGALFIQKPFPPAQLTNALNTILPKR